MEGGSTRKTLQKLFKSDALQDLTLLDPLLGGGCFCECSDLKVLS